MRKFIAGTLAALALLATLSVAGARAQSVQEAALGSGSPRLALFTLLAHPATARSAAARALLQAQGFLPAKGQEGGWKLSARLAPVLYWDDNINGGIPADSVSIAGLTWTVDEDSRAKSGIVLGAEFGASQTRTLGFGKRLIVSESLRLAHAPRHDITLRDARLALCSQNYLERWTFLDLCLGQRWHARDDERTRETWGQAGLSRVLVLGRTPAELGVTLRHGRREDFSQSMATVSGIFALSRIGALGLAWSAGTVPEGHAVVSRAARLSLRRPIRGKLTTLGLDWHREEGGRYLGAAREDQLWTLTLGRPVSARLAAEVGLRRRVSNAGPYSGTGVFVNFRFTGFAMR